MSLFSKKFINTPFNKNLESYSVIEVFVPVGSVYENAKIAGISHFLEHLITVRSKDFHREFTKRGIFINAHTSYYYTRYYFYTIKEYIEDAVYLLKEILLNFRFNEDDIKQEKKLIIEEIQSNKYEPEIMALQKFYKLLFKRTSLALPIIGYKSTIQNLNLVLLKNWHKKFYKKFFLIANGKIKLKRVNINKINIPKAELRPKPFSQIIKNNKLLNNIILNAIILKDNKKLLNRLNFEILSNILLSTETSLLYQKIIQRGLSYKCRCWAEHLNGLSIIFIYIETSKLKETEIAINEVFNNLGNLITKELFELIKSYYLSQLLLEERTGHLGFRAGESLCVFKKIYNSKEIFEIVQKLKYENFRLLAKLICEKGYYKLIFIK